MQWRCKHTYIDGQRLVFSGTGRGLFGLWITWFLLIVITLGIYFFWVAPFIQQWKVEDTDFDPTWQASTLGGTPVLTAIQGMPMRPAITTAWPQATTVPAAPRPVGKGVADVCFSQLALDRVRGLERLSACVIGRKARRCLVPQARQAVHA